jgi:hypothetical protein
MRGGKGKARGGEGGVYQWPGPESARFAHDLVLILIAVTARQNFVKSQIKPSRPIWDRPETRTSFPGFLNTPNRFYALRFP